MPSRALVSLLAALAFTNAPSFAQCPSDDGFEDNDSQATAALLSVGTTTGLIVHGAGHANGYDGDYWLIPSVPQGHEVIVDFHNVTFSTSLSVILTPTQYGNPSGESFAGQDAHVVDSNPAPFAQDYVLFVGPPYSNDPMECDEYTLTLSVVPDPCISASDDAFEDNDSCEAPLALAPGTYTGLRMTPEDRDYYTVVVPAGNRLIVDQTDDGAGMGLKLNPQSACLGSGAETQTDFNGPGGTRTLTWDNDSASPIVVSVQCLIWGASCSFYDLSISLVPSDCSLAAEDAFEPNDDCASSATIAPGTHTGLFMSRTSPDYYEVQVAADSDLTIEVGPLSGAALATLDLFSDAACTNRVDDDEGSSASVHWSNQTGAAATVFAKLAVHVESGDNCANYDLDIFVTPDSCTTSFVDDLYEDNDSCVTAAPLVRGFDPALGLHRNDDDFFTVTLQDGEFVGVYLMENDPYVVLEAFVYDESGTCGDSQTGFLYASDSNNSISTAGFVISHTGSPQGTYVVQARVAAGSSRGCVTYDILTRTNGATNGRILCVGDGSAGAPGAHDTNCPCGNASAAGSGEGCANSLGHGARIDLVGAASAFSTPNALYFSLSQARPNMPAMLLQGSEPIAQPFRDGILCMGSPTERIEAIVTDGAGAGTTTVDASVAGATQPGDVRYYQFWYRDPMTSVCGTGSNLSSAMSVRIE